MADYFAPGIGREGLGAELMHTIAFEKIYMLHPTRGIKNGYLIGCKYYVARFAVTECIKETKWRAPFGWGGDCAL